MRITIAERLLPFSHTPGSRCVIPGTQLAVQVFPALLIIYDISSTYPQEIARHPLNIEGPVNEFTVQLDLEHGYIKVWGQAKNGFYRYRVGKGNDGYAIAVDKSPEQFSLPNWGIMNLLPLTKERLSLGITKQPCWPAVEQRGCLEEVAPFWLRAGQVAPKTEFKTEGTALLLSKESLGLLMQAGFDGMMFPRLEDASYLGVSLTTVKSIFSPLCLLSEGARLIRSLFIQQNGNEISILPEVPHEFYAGRYIHVDCEGKGELDIEWRSRKLRRMIFRCSEEGEYNFGFPKHLKTFRFRERPNIRGVLHNCGDKLALEAGHTYFFDLFQT